MKGVLEQMFGYDFSFDLNSDNTNAAIARRIKAGSSVLEFGPAYGRLTRFLHEALNCTVDIVEMNEESGKSAAQYARLACIGLEEGNIEQDLWQEKLAGQTYDYIIFADVLEHLRQPAEVLTKCHKLLNPNGAILCSIPNIAHASVVLSLLNNDFPYHTTGLLDRTHISFFTNKTFVEMCRRCHYEPVYEHAIASKVGTNELPYNYTDVSGEVENALRFMPNAEAYQYVFELRKEEEAAMITAQKNSAVSAGWMTRCFVKQEQDNAFSEGKQLSKKILSEDVDVTFDLNDFTDPVAVQINLIDCSAILKISKVLVGDRSGVEQERKDFDMSGERYGTDIWNIALQGPQLFLRVPKTTAYIRVIFKIIAHNTRLVGNMADTISEIQSSWQQENQRLLGENQQLQQESQQAQQECQRSQQESRQESEQLQQENQQIRQESEQIRQEGQQVRQQNEELQKDLEQLQQQINLLQQELEAKKSFFKRLGKHN